VGGGSTGMRAREGGRGGGRGGRASGLVYMSSRNIRGKG